MPSTNWLAFLASARLRPIAIKTVFLQGTYVLGITPLSIPSLGIDWLRSVNEDPPQVDKLISIIWCSIKLKCLNVIVVIVEDQG